MDPWHDYETALWCFFNEVNLLHDHEIDLLFYVKHIIEEFLKYSGMILIFFWANHLWKGNGKNVHILHMSPSCLVLCWKRSSSPLRHDQGEIILIYTLVLWINMVARLFTLKKIPPTFKFHKIGRVKHCDWDAPNFFLNLNQVPAAKKDIFFWSIPTNLMVLLVFVRASTN